jgi:hypothetical protein
MKTLMNALALLAMLLFGSVSIEGNASIIYDWQGECTRDCTGVATAQFTLPNDYVPGTRFDCCSLGPITVFYNDDVASFGPNNVDFEGFVVLPVDSGPGTAQLIRETVEDNRWFFNADGTWLTRFESNNVNLPGEFHPHFASGVDGTFTRVSEPSPLALIGMALAALGLVRLRNQIAQ